MIKYLIKYIKSVKSFIKSRSNEEYRFEERKGENYLCYYNRNKEYKYKGCFEIYGYESNKLNKLIRIHYYDNYTLTKYYDLYLPISYNLLIDNLK